MNEKFFIHHFGEKENNLEESFKFYSFFEYDNINKLLSFYEENKELLEIPTYLHSRLSIGDDFTYLFIDLSNGNAQLGFRAMREGKQFLYEHLHLVPDEGLSPFGLQDAVKRIGIDKMHEMFTRIPMIQIPKEVIPEVLYERVSASMENHKISGPIYSKK